MQTLLVAFGRRSDSRIDVDVDPIDLLTENQLKELQAQDRMMSGVKYLNDIGWDTLSGPHAHGQMKVWSFARKTSTEEERAADLERPHPLTRN